MAPFRSIPPFRLFVAVTLLLITAVLARFPAHNGDLPFYIAAVFSAEGFSDSAALAESASEIRNALPPAEAAHHLQNLADAPANFLDFYRMKYGYTGAIRLLRSFGVPYVTATVIPSLIAFFFLGWCIFLWSSRMFSCRTTLLLGLLLLTSTGVLQLGRLSTPDPVSVCLLVWVLYRIRFRGDTGPTLVLLFGALLFRPDNLPVAGGVLFLMRYGYPGTVDYRAIRLSLAGLLVALCAAAAFFALINAISEPRFWWFRPAPYPGVTDYHDPDRFTRFIRSLMRGPLPVLLALAAILSGCHKRLPGIVPALLLFLALMFPVRYLLFPYYEERFYLVFYLAGTLVLAGELAGGRKRGSEVTG